MLSKMMSNNINNVGQYDLMYMLPQIKALKTMFSNIEPGSDRIYDTKKWHQEALHYVITNFFPENPDFEFKYETMVIKQKSPDLIDRITGNKYIERTIYIKLIVRRVLVK